MSYVPVDSSNKHLATLLRGLGAAASREAFTDPDTYVTRIDAGTGQTAAVISYSNGETVAVRVENITGRA